MTICPMLPRGKCDLNHRLDTCNKCARPAGPAGINLATGKEKKICDTRHNDRTARVDTDPITCYNHSMETIHATLAELATLDIDWGFSPGLSDFPHDDNPWFDAEIADTP